MRQWEKAEALPPKISRRVDGRAQGLGRDTREKQQCRGQSSEGHADRAVHELRDKADKDEGEDFEH
jgi:hypothetical protein